MEKILSTNELYQTEFLQEIQETMNAPDKDKNP